MYVLPAEGAVASHLCDIENMYISTYMYDIIGQLGAKIINFEMLKTYKTAPSVSLAILLPQFFFLKKKRLIMRQLNDLWM